MDRWDHWHPVLVGDQLGFKPVAVQLHGRNLVLFRDREGKAAALDDICPHRRLKLSMGNVVQGKLQCLYHGWSFNGCGEGESPGSPKLHACATHYQVEEKFGAIWIKPPGSQAEFPRFEVDGYHALCQMSHAIKAPLELVLDNFCEIEHTPTTHDLFGYPLERMHEVQVEFQTTDATVRVINQGPSKPLNPILGLLLGVGKNYQFMDDWTTHFSPVYSVYDHWWECPKTGKTSRVRWRLLIFFVPKNDHETNLFTFSFVKTNYPGPYGGARVFRRYMRRKLDEEIKLDIRILEGLADQNPSIEGMKLSRFDKVLGLNRERIERIYRKTG